MLVRLSGEDVKKFGELQDYYPGEKQVEVIRICIRTAHDVLRETKAAARKK